VQGSVHAVLGDFDIRQQVTHNKFLSLPAKRD
jgi:hypothetical protein